MSGQPLLTRLRNSFNGLPRAVRILILVQGGLYLLMLILGKSASGTTLREFLALQPARVMAGRVWTLVTYIPFHAGPDAFGAIFNLAVLWSLGGTFGHRWRETHFLFFYFVGGIGAGLVDVLLFLLFPETFHHAILGSSGSSFALFVAFWLIFGESLVSMFGSPPFRGKWVFFGLFGLEMLFFATGSNAHFGVQVGGVVTGWLMVSGRWRPRKARDFVANLRARIHSRQRARRKQRFRVIHQRATFFFTVGQQYGN